MLGQAILYGPSLAGRKILLPLDILAWPGIYLPQTPEVAKIEPQNRSLSDLIYFMEPARRFAASEIHAGRLPMWAPYHFAGAPFIWPKFSPFLALQCATASPVVLAWSQLLAAIVAGLGAYLFCRRVLGGQLLAGGHCCVVLPADRVFRFMARLSHLPAGGLASLDSAGGGQDGARRQCPGADWAERGDCLVLISGQLDVAAKCCWPPAFMPCGAC